MKRNAFTLLELLIVVAVISLLIAILLPGLSAARAQARSAQCISQLRTLGQGLIMYSHESRDVLVPGRLPRTDDCNWQMSIMGRVKYRPTFLVMMSLQVGIPPFEDPQPCASGIDSSGETGERQNYANRVYVCPEVAEWTDERNGSYGYNYQFLGNSRLNAADKFKNWPVPVTRVRDAARTVAAGDGMGTAASWAPVLRQEYDNNAKDAVRLGNEGFNLDPPHVDPVNGEMAGFGNAVPYRSAAHDRHRGRAAMLWVDGHAGTHTLGALGYRPAADGSISFDGDNSLWSLDGRDVPWTPDYKPQ